MKKDQGWTNTYIVNTIFKLSDIHKNIMSLKQKNICKFTNFVIDFQQIKNDTY